MVGRVKETFENAPRRNKKHLHPLPATATTLAAAIDYCSFQQNPWRRAATRLGKGRLVCNSCDSLTPSKKGSTVSPTGSQAELAAARRIEFPTAAHSFQQKW
ncbi:hypothetical protein Csa_007542 [Cucumis sativus]|uniref:Uncharacterized protein n=1 Tax=Cucumis sativus TaxID=3659 RepID=A0A0A0M0W9_CUCSA|nr:hypothetical protein Csa_007542 [Cucumis sativus]